MSAAIASSLHVNESRNGTASAGQRPACMVIVIKSSTKTLLGSRLEKRLMRIRETGNRLLVLVVTVVVLI